jgi:hypothetical protein
VSAIEIKNTIMKQKAINHEVLLLTGTSFSKRQFSPKNNNQANDSRCSDLQNACWNELVFDILPGIINPFSGRNLSYTWEVVSAESFLEVKIGAAPYDVEKGMSLNPHLFLSKKNIN